MTTALTTISPAAEASRTQRFSQAALNIGGIITGTLLTLTVVGIVFGLMFIAIPQQNIQLLTLVIGAIMGSFATVIAFYFAGSVNQVKSADTLNQQAVAVNEAQRVIADVRRKLDQTPTAPTPAAVPLAAVPILKPDWITEAEWSGMSPDAQKAAADEWAALDVAGKAAATAERAGWTAEQRAQKVAQYAPAAPAAVTGS